MTSAGKVRTYSLLVLLLLAAYGLRVFMLDTQSLWWDEGISLHLAISDLQTLLSDRLNNIHPPLYFVILKGWLALTGVSAFTARYLSVLAGLLTVPLAFVAARDSLRLLAGDGTSRTYARAAVRPVPWIAFGLALLSPLLVIYAQEVRVYAMLPPVYLLMLVLAGRQFAGAAPRPPSLVALLVTEWVALHLHYIAAVGVALIGLWGVLHYVRRRPGPGLGIWLLGQGVVLLASLPWFAAVVANWPAIGAEAGAGTFSAEPVPLMFLFSQLWVFHLTGLAGALADPFVQRVAAATAVLAILLVTAALVAPLLKRGDRYTADRRRAAVYWLAVWLLPLLAALIVWSVRSFSHPRYVIMYTVGFLPLAAILAHPHRSWLGRLTGAGFVACLVVLSVWGLGQYFFAFGAAKPDMRGVARYLEETAVAGDLIVIPDTDWSLPFEYGGEAAVIMPGFEAPAGEPDSLAAALDCRYPAATRTQPCAVNGRVFMVDYDTGTRDWQNRLPFELDARGYLSDVRDFDDLSVRTYRLISVAPGFPACSAQEPATDAIAGEQSGSLRARSVWIEPDAAANTAVAVALCWELPGAAADDYSVSLVLADPVTGEWVGQADSALLDRRGAPTSHWEPGSVVETYHVVPIRPGTPPLSYELLGTVYVREGDVLTPVALEVTGASNAFALGETSLSPGAPVVPTPYGLSLPAIAPDPLMTAEGLSLYWAGLANGRYRPGEILRAPLLWRAGPEPLPDLEPRLILEQNGVILAESQGSPAQGRYPTSGWQPGEWVSEVRELRVPGEADGVASLSVAVGHESYPLATLTIDGEAVSFERPARQYDADVSFGDVGRLAGYDMVPGDAGRDVTLVLYWEALSGEITQDLAVFVHALDERGEIVAQHDGRPALGARPTTTWLLGEYVRDPHPLPVRADGLTQPLAVAVGLYDPASGQRLTTGDGQDRAMLTLPPPAPDND